MDYFGFNIDKDIYNQNKPRKVINKTMSNILFSIFSA